MVILFYGYSAEKTSLLDEARAFLDLGASVLLVDFRGSGGSSESYTTVGVHEAEDVAAAIRYARERLSHGNVFLFARSMGAAAILRAVRAHAVQLDGVMLRQSSKLDARSATHADTSNSEPSAISTRGPDWARWQHRHHDRLVRTGPPRSIAPRLSNPKPDPTRTNAPQPIGKTGAVRESVEGIALGIDPCPHAVSLPVTRPRVNVEGVSGAHGTPPTRRSGLLGCRLARLFQATCFGKFDLNASRWALSAVSYPAACIFSRSHAGRGPLL